MGLEASLPTNLWPETVICAGYIANRTPIRQLGWKTPFEVVYGSKPGYSHLRIFGCRAYALKKHILNSRKLDSRAHIGHLVGYESTNIFKIWIPSRNKVIKTRDVTFDEDTFYDPKDLDIGAVLRESAEDLIQTISLPEWNDNEMGIEEVNEIINIPSNPKFIPIIGRLNQKHSQSSPKFIQLDFKPKDDKITIAPKNINGNIDKSNIIEGKRKRKLVNFSTFHNSFAAAKNSVMPDKIHRRDLPAPPRNHWEVLQHQYSAGFKAAELKEFNTLFDKDLCRKISKKEAIEMEKKGIVESGIKPLPLMWIYTYKVDADGYLLSFKARLVARGVLQHSTEETYATTLAAQVFRAVIAISAAYDYKIRQYDIVAAYTNADLQQPLIASLPDGFKVDGQLLLIKKALYGLSESAKLWQNHLQATLLDLGLSPVPGIKCLFTNNHLILLFYVDDIVVVYHERDNAKADYFEENLMKRYQTKPLGQISHFLGIRVVRDEQKRKIWLVQDSYMDALAKEFKIDLSKSAIISTPLPMTPLRQNTGQATAREIHRYQQRVGKLNYPAVITRPDIAHGVSKHSEFLQNPSKEHMEAAEYMMKYLIQTKYRGIEYNGDAINTHGRAFVASSDASFADDPDTRCSSNGFCFQLFDGMVHWKATKQKTVTASSTEAELLALCANCNPDSLILYNIAKSEGGVLEMRRYLWKWT
ncbi:hypothetical protein K3495_g4940 [Podosphaera aphanis]|nr:hypothetical protein K3495_g4940 [Podosphaera aphanis]